MKSLMVAAISLLACPVVDVLAQKKAPLNNEKAEALYEMGTYQKALVEYFKMYKKDPKNPELQLRIAEAILQEDMPRDTACFFIDNYIQAKPEDVEGYYLAALAHYHAHHFTKAKKHLSNYMQMINDPGKLELAEHLQSTINSAQRMMKDTLKVRLVNLGPNVNGPSNEMNPYITPDNSTLFFSSDEKYSSALLLKYYNIKFSQNLGLEWTKSKACSGINTNYDEYVTGIRDGGIFFTSNQTSSFAISTAEYKGNGKFADIKTLGGAIDQQGDEIAATITSTGDTIIFSGQGADGDMNLYYSINMNGRWSEARELPGEVNAFDSDENNPMLSPDGLRLYFASNRLGSMGGYDIYYSDLDPREWKWGKPIQMKYPINDTYDNMTISLSSDKRYAYISSIRKGGFGGRDVYAVVYENVSPTTAIIKCSLSIAAKPKPVNLTTMPLIEVFDTDGQIVATSRYNLKSQTFILALDPGVYELHIDSPEAAEFTQKIVVDEKVYSQDVVNKAFVLPAK